MIKRLVIIILVIFLFSFDLLPKNSTNARGADELFEFIKKKTGNKFPNGIILTYIKFGYLDKAIPLIEKSEDKYSLLMYALKHINSSLEKQLPQIKIMAFNLDSTYYKNYLLLELAIAYAKFGKTRESKKIFSGIREAIEQEDDLYENVLRFSEPFGLISCLIEAGFIDDAEQLLYEKENTANKFSDPYNLVSAFDFIVQRYCQLDKKEKIIDIIERIGKMDFTDGQVDPIIPQTLFEFGEVLLKIEEFERAQKLFVKAFKVSELVSNSEDIACLYADHFLNDSKGTTLMRTLGGIDEITEIIKKIPLNTRLESSSKSRRLYQTIIKFFVNDSKFKEAISMAHQLDKMKKKLDYIDYYYFCQGEHFSKSKFYLSASLKISRKIENKSLRIELLLKIAKEFSRMENLREFHEIMDKILDLVMENRNDVEVTAKAKDISEIWLEADFPGKALEIMKYETDDNEKSWLIYDIAQLYATNYNLQFARKLAFDEKNLNIRALILSKIAARMMCDEKNDAIIVFKKACLILIENNFESFLSVVFHDYLNARVYKKVVRIDIMSLFPEI